MAVFPWCHLIRAAPLPANGVFPNPGFPKYIESGWVQINDSKIEGQVSIFYNGQAVAQILADDGKLSTQMMNITSYECLDSNTYRYIADQMIYPEKTSATICVTEFANATHRFSAVMPSGDEGCPDSPFAATKIDDINGSKQTHSIFLREEGVLPRPTEKTCINQPNPYIPPLSPIPIRDQPNRTISEAPYTLTYGAPVGQGVWKSRNIIVVENRRFYASVFLNNGSNTPTVDTTETEEFSTSKAPITATNPGHLYAVVGVFFSHYCLSPTEFASTSIVTRIFQNGEVDYGTSCQNGTRSTTPQQEVGEEAGERSITRNSNNNNTGVVDNLYVKYALGPRCSIWSIPEPTDANTTTFYSLELVQPLTSNPDVACVFNKGVQPIDANTPSNSGARAAVLVAGAWNRVHMVLMVLFSIVVVACFC